MTVPQPQQGSKPAVIIACPPVHGHTLPFLSHATALIKKGYSVHFLAGVISEIAIRNTGSSFHAINPVHPEEAISGTSHSVGTLSFGCKAATDDHRHIAQLQKMALASS